MQITSTKKSEIIIFIFVFILNDVFPALIVNFFYFFHDFDHLFLLLHYFILALDLKFQVRLLFFVNTGRYRSDRFLVFFFWHLHLMRPQQFIAVLLIWVEPRYQILLVIVSLTILIYALVYHLLLNKFFLLRHHLQ